MKTYKREGRRFVEIPNYEGYYYNEDGTFSKEKKGNSIGLCILQTAEKRTICELNPNPTTMTWEKGMAYCTTKFNGKGYMPTIEVLLWARNKFRNLFPSYGLIWSSTESEYGYLARSLYLSNGSVLDGSKDNFSQVFAFLELPV